jgi:hypothetical protein
MADPFANAIRYPDGSIAFDPTPEQLRFLQSAAPMLLAHGNRGGGKTSVARWKCHLMAMAYPGFKYAVIRNTLGELKKSVIEDGLIGELDRLGGSYHRTDNVARYANGSIGFYVGVDDQEAMLKLLGGQYGLIWVEELTTVDWSTVVDITSCLRVKKTDPFKAQFIATTNPFGPSEYDVRVRWITKDISRDEDPDYDPTEYEAVEIQRDSNPHLDTEAYEKNLRRQTNPAKRAAWLHGTWGAAQGSFFRDFQPTRDEKDWHVLRRLPVIGNAPLTQHPVIPVYCGVDWGRADDPAVCVWVAVLPNNRAIVIKERKWFRTPAREVAHEIIGHSRGMSIKGYYADPTMWNGERAGAQSVAALFELEGVPLTPSINDRKCDALHEYLRTTLDDGLPMLQFFAENVPELIRVLPMQKPNKHDPERMADSSTDHLPLALHYFCAAGVVGREPATIPTLPRWIQPVKGDKPVLGSESVRR